MCLRGVDIREKLIAWGMFEKAKIFPSLSLNSPSKKETPYPVNFAIELSSWRGLWWLHPCNKSNPRKERCILTHSLRAQATAVAGAHDYGTEARSSWPACPCLGSKVGGCYSPACFFFFFFLYSAQNCSPLTADRAGLPASVNLRDLSRVSPEACLLSHSRSVRLTITLSQSQYCSQYCPAHCSVPNKHACFLFLKKKKKMVPRCGFGVALPSLQLVLLKKKKSLQALDV